MKIITYGNVSLTDITTQDLPFRRVPLVEYPQQVVDNLIQHAKKNADLWYTPHPTRSRIGCVTPNT